MKQEQSQENDDNSVSGGSQTTVPKSWAQPIEARLGLLCRDAGITG